MLKKELLSTVDVVWFNIYGKKCEDMSKKDGIEFPYVPAKSHIGNEPHEKINSKECTQTYVHHYTK